VVASGSSSSAAGSRTARAPKAAVARLSSRHGRSRAPPPRTCSSSTLPNTRTRIARWCVARCLRSLGCVGEALAEQRALAADLEAAGEVDGYIDEEIGECLLALGRDDEARPFLGRAYAELSGDAGLQADKPERLACLRSPGMV
jgi:hypothetical protein